MGIDENTEFIFQKVCSLSLLYVIFVKKNVGYSVHQSIDGNENENESGLLCKNEKSNDNIHFFFVMCFDCFEHLFFIFFSSSLTNGAFVPSDVQINQI